MKPKQIKRSDAARLTAEARGWRLYESGWRNAELDLLHTFNSWNPLASKDQCFELLDEVCDANQWEATMLRDGGEYSVDIQSDETGGCACCVETVTHGKAWNCETLNEAIVLAYLEAKTNQPHEFKD